jgi:hypothetical protein
MDVSFEDISSKSRYSEPKRAVFKLKKIEIRKNMTESKEKPLATWLMKNIVLGDGSEYLDFEEISSKLTSILPKKKVGT